VTAPDEIEPASRIHAWFGARTPWQRRGIAFAAGALAVLGHAPFQFAPAYVVALTVLVWLLDAASRQQRPLRAAFATAWCFAAGQFLVGLHWVSSAFMVDAATWGAGWGWGATAALAFVLALYWGAGAALAMAVWTRDWRRVAVFAACLFATEWLRGHFPLGGFPWLLPGYIWAPGEPISQLASVMGAYGLTLLTLLACAAPATLADGGLNAGRRVAPVLIAALAFGMVWGWGAQRLAQAPVSVPGALPVVRVADSGLGQAEKWRAAPDQEWRVLQRYLDASGEPEGSEAAIVVWGEGAIPVVNFFMLENPDFLDAIGRGLGDRVLIVGLTRRAMEGDELAYYNSAAIIDGVGGDARVSPQIYDKNHLVPGGEYLPFEDFISGLNIASLQAMGGWFTPGAPPSRMVVAEAPSPVILICYEAIFPGMVPRGAERPGWIVNLTNDAWFGGGIGPQQHYVQARYRAIEEGLPLARAASGGVSAIIDSFGREASSTPAGGVYAQAQLPPALVETVMARYGNIIVIVLLFLIGGLRWLPRWGRRGA
jgi:apolipoprotein N-acyltransferase